MSAPATGSYLVVVGDGSSFLGNSGTYEMTVNGLSDALKAGIPDISGTTLNVGGVGGAPGTNAVLYTTTNLLTPFAQWTPIWTNQFDQYGVFDYTNSFNPAEHQRFFRLSHL